MTDVLSRIVARKRVEVAASGGPLPAAEPTVRSLKSALANPGARFIMEVKRRSPSGHVARHSVADALRAYAPVADAISVLTDGADFGGSLDDLRFVRAHYDGPILAKDFIVDPGQVIEARSAGADAVLAMLSVLDDATAEEVMRSAGKLAMDVIVEVHDESEMRRAISLGAGIIGINNRDLKTLRTDLAVTERLCAMAPDDALLISESGIASRKDVERLARHVDAFLVGSSLMASDDIAQEAKALVHGRVKICGMTSIEDVALAGHFATHAGLILVPGTPRFVGAERAHELAGAARHKGLRTVGVFRDQPVEEVIRQSLALQLDAVQLHGTENEPYVGQLRSGLPETIEIWALRGVDGRAVGPARGADRSLFDTLEEGRSGGLGRSFDWSALTGCEGLSTGFVAGGIDPSNAARASALGSYGLDLCSGVESGPGVKDSAKIEALFAALRPATRRQA